MALRRLLGRLRLRHFELLAELGHEPNIARCARRLNMTQPTASKLLREIESILEVELFTRNRRGLTPTPAGRAMTRRAAMLLAETEAAHEEMMATQRGATRRLRLGVFPVAIPAFLSLFCEHLQARWPGVVIAMEEGIEQRLLSELAAGTLDCILGRVVLETLTPDLRHDLLFREPTVIVCGTHHPIRHAAPDPMPALLAKCRWILPATRGAAYNMVASRLAQYDLPAPVVMYETTSVFITLEMLSRTDLLSILPAGVAHDYAAAGKIGLVPTPPLQSDYAVGLVYRMEAGGQELMRTVREAAQQAARDAGLRP